MGNEAKNLRIEKKAIKFQTKLRKNIVCLCICMKLAVRETFFGKVITAIISSASFKNEAKS